MGEKDNPAEENYEELKRTITVERKDAEWVLALLASRRLLRSIQQAGEDELDARSLHLEMKLTESLQQSEEGIFASDNSFLPAIPMSFAVTAEEFLSINVTLLQSNAEATAKLLKETRGTEEEHLTRDVIVRHHEAFIGFNIAYAQAGGRVHPEFAKVYPNFRPFPDHPAEGE